MPFLQLAGGLLILVAGAEILVRSASAMALRLGVSPLVVSLTLVALGTSAPEVFVTVHAGMTGRTDLALGNVLGSNVANVGLVIGICGLFRTLTAGPRLLRLDVPAVILLTVAVGGLALAGGGLSRLDGLLLLAVFAAYFGGTVRSGLAESRRQASGRERGSALRWVVDAVTFGAGLAGLVLGSRWLVDGASGLAMRFGMPEALVGSTIVAVGTSLPEVATSLVATLRREIGVAVGNAVGSCVANLGLVLGSACLAAGTIPVPEHLVRTDVLAALAISLVLLVFLSTRHRVVRVEAVMLLLAYGAYLLLVSRTASQSPWPVGPVLAAAYAVLLLVIVRLDRRRPPSPA